MADKPKMTTDEKLDAIACVLLVSAAIIGIVNIKVGGALAVVAIGLIIVGTVRVVRRDIRRARVQRNLQRLRRKRDLAKWLENYRRRP